MKRTTPKIRPAKTWDDAPLVMNTAYLSALLGLSPRKIQRMVANGELPVIDPKSGSFRYEKTAVMAALKVVR